VPLALLNILVPRIITEILSVVGCIELFINNGRVFGYYGLHVACITLLMLFLVQRLAKDYDGARTIVIHLLYTRYFGRIFVELIIILEKELFIYDTKKSI
jgi:hypothetical protein